MKKKQLSIRLPESLLAWGTKQAKSESNSFNGLVLRLLKEERGKLEKAYLSGEYNDYESLNNMADSLVPEGMIVKTTYDSVEVLSLDELELNEDDLFALKEDGMIDTDDVNIRIISN